MLHRSGFVGTEVVKQLLEKGYTVRATVRSTSNKQKVAHLLALGEALPGEAAACPPICHSDGAMCWVGAIRSAKVCLIRQIKVAALHPSHLKRQGLSAADRAANVVQASWSCTRRTC